MDINVSVSMKPEQNDYCRVFIDINVSVSMKPDQ